jgi:hypothetical protein
MTTFTNVFTGALVAPALAAYNSITLTATLQLQWPLETAPNSNLCTPLIDINSASTGSYGLILPPATSVGVGTFIIVNNLSAYSQTVYNNSGQIIVASQAGTSVQAAGSVFFYYLQNNSTAAGTWFAFQYGSAVSTPSVAAIAGNGLVALGSQLAQNMSVTTLSAPYTIGVNDRDKFFNWNAGAGTVTLPQAATAGAGYYVQLRNSGSSILSVAPVASDTINGAYSAGTPLPLNPGDSCFIVTDGTLWYTIGLGPSIQAAFNFVTISLTGLSGTYTLSGTQLNQVGYRFTGTKSGNVQIVVPSTKQEYWVNNQTDNTYTLSVETSGQTSPAPPTVAYNGSVILYCDGSNVYNATPSSAITSIPIPIAQGGTNATTAASALTNLGGTSIGTTLFTATTNAVAQQAIGAPSTADMFLWAMVL